MSTEPLNLESSVAIGARLRVLGQEAAKISAVRLIPWHDREWADKHRRIDALLSAWERARETEQRESTKHGEAQRQGGRFFARGRRPER